MKLYFVLVSGTRRDKPGLRAIVRGRLQHHLDLATACDRELVVIHGGQRGTDMHADDWARDFAQPSKFEGMFQRDPDRGPFRNKVMLVVLESLWDCRFPAAIECFPNKDSFVGGTRGLIRDVPKELQHLLTITEV